MKVTSDDIREIIGNNEIYADSYVNNEDFRVLINTLLESVDNDTFTEIVINMIYSYMTLYNTVFDAAINVGDPETIKAIESVLKGMTDSGGDDGDEEEFEVL